MYLALTSLGRISFRGGLLCTGLINTLLSLARSRHKCTFSLVIGIRMKLLHNLDFSSTSSGTVICCFLQSI